jgi:CBS domain-containing protein
VWGLDHAREEELRVLLGLLVVQAADVEAEAAHPGQRPHRRPPAHAIGASAGAASRGVAAPFPGTPCRGVHDMRSDDMGQKARDVMTEAPAYLKEDAPVSEAAKRMADEDAGALPVCRADGKLVGMVTDRDVVVKVLASGKDPSKTTAGELASDQSEAVTIGADDSVEDALRTMADHKVRRLPVIDGTEMVGIVAQADLARACPPEKAGEMLAAISS